MSYRPITDIWFMARAKLKGGEKYYGAYLGGFPERARALLGVAINDPVLHVCGGKAKLYPYKRAFGPSDKTLDLDAALEPDYLRDARLPLPPEGYEFVPGGKPDPDCGNCFVAGGRVCREHQKKEDILWPAILADPPYSEADAEKYAPGSAAYLKPNALLKNCLEAVRVGGRVGIIHYILPSPPKNAHFVACIGVICGYNNRMRCYSVFERTE